jgi:hypothetical protein
MSRTWRSEGPRISVVIQPDVRDALEKRAKRADLNISQYIRRVLRMHVERDPVAHGAAASSAEAHR